MLLYRDSCTLQGPAQGHFCCNSNNLGFPKYWDQIGLFKHNNLWLKEIVRLNQKPGTFQNGENDRVEERFVENGVFKA